MHASIWLAYLQSDQPLPPSQQSLDPPLITAIIFVLNKAVTFCDVIIQGPWSNLKDLTQRVATLCIRVRLTRDLINESVVSRCQ